MTTADCRWQLAITDGALCPSIQHIAENLFRTLHVVCQWHLVCCVDLLRCNRSGTSSNSTSAVATGHLLPWASRKLAWPLFVGIQWSGIMVPMAAGNDRPVDIYILLISIFSEDLSSKSFREIIRMTQTGFCSILSCKINKIPTSDIVLIYGIRILTVYPVKRNWKNFRFFRLVCIHGEAVPFHLFCWAFK